MMSIGLHQTSRSSSSMISAVFLFSVTFIWSSVDCWSYYYSNTTMNWKQAREYCTTHHTDMVAIQNQEEIAHLNSWLPPKPSYYWIGIRKVKDVWTWVGTGKALTEEATNWAQNEPNNGNKNSLGSEDCVEMYIKRTYQAGKWNDERCGKLKTALCYSAACKNDSCLYGECVETINSHRCQCHEGFYGERCEHVLFCNSDEVPAPDNGSVNCTHTYGDFAFASECQYSCEEGYMLSEARPLKCTANKTWSHQPPTCELIQCPKLSRPDWGSVKCSDPLGPFSFRSTCAFTCDEGYVLSEPQADAVFCESTGQWNATQPFCTAVQCPVLTEQSHLTITCEGNENTRFSFGKSCSFDCAPGFTLVGASTMTCTSSAEWSQAMPICEAVQCPALQNPENGVTDCGDDSGTKFSFENTCSFRCLPGYELEGATEVTCTSESEWSDSLPHCKAVQCPAIPEMENTIVNCEGDANTKFSYRNSCSFSCRAGYRLIGAKTLTCTASAEWSGTPPHCQVVLCPALEKKPNLIMDCSSDHSDLVLGSTCSFSCKPGFLLQGKDKIECLEDGQWDKATPICEAVQCPALSEQSHLTITCEGNANTGFGFGKSCSFDCAPGFTLVGASTTTCTSSAEWSQAMPICEAVQCPALLNPENGVTDCGDDSGTKFSFENTCSFRCLPGYELEGATEVTCTSESEWSDSLPHCKAVVCPFLEAPQNGHINCSLKEPLYTSQCSFSCDQDHTLDGLTILTCGHHGNWSGDMPTCQPAPSQMTLVAAGVTAGGAVSLSGLSLVMWILRRLRKKASKFDLSSSDIEVPPQVYKNSLSDSLL